MNNILKNIFIGMGSVLVIMPPASVSKILVQQKSDAEKLASDWQKLGNDFRSAMGQVDNDQKK